MGLFDYFKPVSTMTAEEVRDFLRNRSADSLNLVDVRQPHEYEAGHLPGAVLMPLAEIPNRLGELDRSRPTITYCGAGVRSRAAASILEEAGFSPVSSMSGGINAWNGLVAEGGYEEGLVYFSRASGAEELISLSWALEEGNRAFYERLSADAGEGAAASLFRSLVRAEENHKATLAELHARVTRKAGPLAPPEGIAAGDFLEDGSRVDSTLARVRGKSIRGALDILISVEANAMDRYVKMGRAVSDADSRKVFLTLAEEERAHLQKLSDLLERMPPG
ncbi:MAG: rhodanese-like domain-containing protein [Thermodesulfobacteriota bacterium]